jgi:hypothetical protein
VKEQVMEKDLPHPELVASARQIMDIPEEDDMHDEDGPLTITWYALGHAAVLLYLALYALKIMSPMERGLAGGTTLLVGLTLAFLLRTTRAERQAATALRPKARTSPPPSRVAKPQ